MSPTPALRTTVRTAGGRTTVVLAGELDVASVDELDRVLTEVAEGSPTAVVVDVGALTFLDAAGVGVLLRAQRRVAARGGSLELVRPTRLVARVLDVLQLREVLVREGRGQRSTT